MSVYSTLYISREVAIEIIKKQLESYCDEKIANLMDTVLQERLNNCIIVPVDQADDDGYVKDLYDLPNE